MYFSAILVLVFIHVNLYKHSERNPIVDGSSSLNKQICSLSQSLLIVWGRQPIVPDLLYSTRSIHPSAMSFSPRPFRPVVVSPSTWIHSSGSACPLKNGTNYFVHPFRFPLPFAVAVLRLTGSRVVCLFTGRSARSTGCHRK